MPFIDYAYDGTEHEYEATTYTLMVYEQEFKSDMIKDVFGHVSIDDRAIEVDDEANVTSVDYTVNNWSSYPKALWAMLKTSEAIARADGYRHESVPSYGEWSCKLKTNLYDVVSAVISECNRGLFYTGAAASE